MENAGKTKITITTTVNVTIEKVWQYWTMPEHITQWCSGSPDWHTPKAENDLRIGGKFSTRMEAKDGSMGFDFWGIYNEVVTEKRIAYTTGDDRKVEIDFTADGDATKIVEKFEAENENPVDMQRAGWQNILDNFKSYIDAN